MTKRLAAFAVSLLMTLGFSLTVAGPASAADEKPASCTNASVCGYVNSLFRTNQGYELIPSRSAGVCVYVAFPDAWSGIWNNSGRTVRVFKNGSCSGSDYLTYYNGTGHGQLSVQHPTWENKIRAVRFI
jgi:hypothetical protein